MNDEKLFVVCNIPKFLDKMMKNVRDKCCNYMTKEELYGYDHAVDTILEVIKSFIYSVEVNDGILVHSNKINGEYDTEGFDLQGLLELFECRVVAQNINE